MVTKDVKTIQCPKCQAVFERTAVNDKLRRYRDRRIMRTLYCPNCDARVILGKDDELLLERLERLKEQAKRLGDQQEVRELQDEIDRINRGIEMNAGKTKDKKFFMKDNGRFFVTDAVYRVGQTINFKYQGQNKQGSIINIDDSDPKSTHYHVVDVNDADHDYFVEMDKESKITKHVSKGGWSDSKTKDSLFKGQKVTAIKSEQGLREGETYTVLGDEEVYNQIVGESNATVYKLQDSSGNVIVVEGPCEGLFYEVKDSQPVYKSGDYSVYQDEPNEFVVFVEGVSNTIGVVETLNKAKNLIKEDRERYASTSWRERGKIKDAKTKDVTYPEDFVQYGWKLRQNGRQLIATHPEHNLEYRGTPYEIVPKLQRWLTDYNISKMGSKDEEPNEEEKKTLKFKIGELRKNMDAARRMGYDTEPYQKEIDKLETKSCQEIKDSDYDLGSGHLGNGITIWNRAKQEHGDYQKIAHIGPDRKIMWMISNPPAEVKNYVENIAKGSNLSVSSSQPHMKVFHDESVNYKGYKIILTEADDEWKYSIFQGSKKLADGTDFDKQSARISAEDEIDSFLSKDAKVRDDNEWQTFNYRGVRISYHPNMGYYYVYVKSKFGDGSLAGPGFKSLNEAKAYIDQNQGKVEFSDISEKFPVGSYVRVNMVGSKPEQVIKRDGTTVWTNKGTYHETKVVAVNDFYTKDPLTKKGQKILAAMKKVYGEEKGEQVFYASRNKGTISGVDKAVKDSLSDMDKKQLAVGKRFKIVIPVEMGEPLYTNNFSAAVEMAKEYGKGTMVVDLTKVSDSKTKDDLFTSQMIEKLRNEYSEISAIDPSQPTYGKLIALLDKLDKDQLKQLANAGIKFVSKLALNRVSRDSKTKDEKRMKFADLVQKAKEGYFELQSDPKPRNYIEVKYPSGKKEWIFVEDQEIKITIGEDPVNSSPTKQKVEGNDVIYKEYILKQLPENGEFEVYTPGGSIVGHAKALELAKLFVDRIVASKIEG